MELSKLNEETVYEGEDWWHYEPPRTPYDLVGNNLITNFLRPYIYLAIRFYFKYFHKLRVSGYNPIFSKHSYIIVSNHSSHLDTPLIFSCFPFKNVNKIRAVAALDYFFSNPIIRVLSHLLCNIIPISRKSADFMAISMCKEILASGGNIIIYPEGTRTRTGKIGEFKPGVGLLLKKTKVSVLPVFIKGTFECFNYKKIFPSFGPIEITFGSPMEFTQQVLNKLSYKEIAERLRKAVIAISQNPK